MWSIHTMEYHSALKKDGLLMPPMPWLDLGDTVLRERSRHKGHAVCGFTYTK